MGRVAGRGEGRARTWGMLVLKVVVGNGGGGGGDGVCINSGGWVVVCPVSIL